MYIKDTSYNKVSYTTLVGNVCRGVLQMFANDILPARIEDWIIMAWSNFFNPELKIEDLKQNFFNRELKFRRLWIKCLLRSWHCKLQLQSLKTEYAWNLDVWWCMMFDSFGRSTSTRIELSGFHFQQTARSISRWLVQRPMDRDPAAGSILFERSADAEGMSQNPGTLMRTSR